MQSMELCLERTAGVVLVLLGGRGGTTGLGEFFAGAAGILVPSAEGEGAAL